MKPWFFVWILLVCVHFSCSSENELSNEPLKVDVLVIGGGTSGVAAGIQSARLGATTLIVEEGPWLGGMLTAAGVSATDGNHNLPSGLWGEFRNRLYDHYGSVEAVATGWVSNTHFEPHIGDSVWKKMVRETGEPLAVRYHARVNDLLYDTDSMIIGASFIPVSGDNEPFQVYSKVIIDASELGDALKLAGTESYIGQDARTLTQEPLAPVEATPYIQDLTYVAILKDYGSNNPYLLDKPDSYDPDEFTCLCKEICDDESFTGVDCETMLNYAKLPNNYYLINWPNNGNDYYLNPLDLPYEQRLVEYEKAKQRTLNWIYHIQSVAGYTNLGLADDIFPTEDHLALIPYHRESRRIKGKVFLTAEDLREPYRNTLYQQAIAVGDYPLDHHHKKNPEASNEFTPETEYPIPSFSVPYHALIPENYRGIIAAEKSISVSHLANGSTRLQPCVLGIGQAAGAAAAISVRSKTSPHKLPVRTLQDTLLSSGCWLLPFIDSNPADRSFIPLQKMGVTGLLKGHGVPYQWANQTWIYPDSVVSSLEGIKILKQIGLEIPKPFSRESVVSIVTKEGGQGMTSELEDLLKKWEWVESDEWIEGPITRAQLAILIDATVDLFERFRGEE